MTQRKNNLLLGQLMEAYNKNNPQLVPEKYRQYMINKIKEKFVEFKPVSIFTEEEGIIDEFERYVEANQKYKY